jgi:ubiquinone/menaquinone biosynthesis C-methylase UbiE
MSFYAERVLPRLLHLVMRQENLAAYRRRWVPEARGRVLEIGVGSGLNLPLYGDAASEVIGLDTSPRLLDMARDARSRSRVGTIELLEGSAEAIPMESASVDTVVMTWTLCSIPDARAALREMRRVLRPSGQLLFVEHGTAPNPRVRKWQDRLTPLWRRVAGGCHLNRPVRELLEQSGFEIERIDAAYMPGGPKPMTFMYEGCAKAR